VTGQRPAAPPARTRVLAVLALVVVALLVWWVKGGDPDPGQPSGATPTASAPSGPTPSDPGATPTPSTPATETATVPDGPGTDPGADGIPPCDPGELPPEVDDVVDDILSGGPFDHPRNDGVRFQNREGILPDEDPGYYREYTVTTPGAGNRGARRIVTGGEDAEDPERWYYTGDHYESFCSFVP
jgi:ribonuclease T1